MCIAKSRRTEALKMVNSDRVLVKPAANIADLRLPEANTIAAYMIDALGEGLTLEQLVEATDWSKSRIMTNLYKMAKKTGVGIQRRSSRLHLALPSNACGLIPEDMAPAMN